MGIARSWIVALRRAFIKSNCKTVIILDDVDGHNSITYAHKVRLIETVSIAAGDDGGWGNEDLEIAGEINLAAIKIQSYFRGHLARRAYRALRSLVRVQAVVRGACARRQATLAIRCMQAMVRLQGRVRARQLLHTSDRAQIS